MGVIAEQFDSNDLTKLQWLDGPWSNASCIGYAIDAMKRLGYERVEIAQVVSAMKECFDDTTVKEAANHWYNF